MRKVAIVALAAILAVGAWSSANAWTLNFENAVGNDGTTIASGIPGLQFTTTSGFDWVYADATTGGYNVQSNNGTSYGTANWFMEGNGFAWLGPNQGQGRIDFLNQDGGFFQTGYSCSSNFYLEAYDKNGNLITSSSGAANTVAAGGTGLNYLNVSSASKNIAYVLLHDTGNQWLTDNMTGDASGVPDQTPPGGVPEPATMLLFGLGLVGGAIRKRMQK